MIETILNVMLVPLQVILLPIDALISQIRGLELIPSLLNQLTDLFQNIPATFVHLIGVQPIIWNAFLTIFILDLTVVPSINILKRIWAWIRP